MPAFSIILIYHLYGLAFFCMGLLVAIEGGRSRDPRLRKALRPLAGFGLIHGVHEWLEMFENVQLLYGYPIQEAQHAVRLAILAFSFISLAAFGAFLLANSPALQRISMLVPVAMEAVWSIGLLIFLGRYGRVMIWDIADAWTRYTLAIPASLLAAAGLIVQQRVFRRAGLIRFGQDSLWAAVAFGWYGLFGQFFTKQTPIFPSNIINSHGFEAFFGFPIQLLRASMAITATVFIIRFLRAFQVETDQRIAKLQEERLHAAEQGEALRRELYQSVVAAQESERQRIARDLHDETGQSLTAIGMGLRGLATSLAQEGVDAEQLKNLRRLESMSTQALEELQRLISDLRPPQIDDLGLPAAVRWLGGQVQERTGLNVTVDFHGSDQHASPAVNIAMFRIIQEALNNIVKHAEAKNAHIQLICEDDQLSAIIRDDGRGFDINTVQRESSTRRPTLGLAGMQERASLFGGSVVVTSKPGEGTQVKAVIPCQFDDLEANNGDPFVAGG